MLGDALAVPGDFYSNKGQRDHRKTRSLSSVISSQLVHIAIQKL